MVLLTALLQLFWSWRNTGAGSPAIEEAIVVDPEKDSMRPPAASEALITRARVHRDMRMPMHLQPTGMPIVPASEHGAHHGTAHTRSTMPR